MERLIVLLPLVLVACATPQGSYCDIAKPIRLSSATVAVLSDAEVTAVLTENRKLQAECGVKP